MKKVDRHIRAVIVYFLMFFASFIFSQGVVAANDQVLEEIIVSARKTEESLQDIPLSISAFTGDDLKYRGAKNISYIADFSPNLTYQNNPSFSGSSNSAAVYIRGVGQKEFLPTTEPGVGIYMDGVYIARSVGGILDLVDIERVEILRGPQGTLFGRNTIGGAISLTTKKPSTEFSGSIEAKAGNNSRQDIKGIVNLPITDNLLSSISLASFNQDGHVTRQDGIDLGDDDTMVGRIAVTWQASDDIVVDFSVDKTRDRENGPAMTLIGIIPAAAGGFTPELANIHNARETFSQTSIPNPALFPSPPFPIPAPCAIGGVTLAPPDVPVDLSFINNCYDNTYVQGKSFNAGTAPAFSDADLESATLRVEWIVNDWLEIRSITGYRDLDSEFFRDGDHSPATISQFFDSLEQDQISQEFQFLGTMLDDELRWIVGLYYFEEDGDNINLLDFGVSQFRSGGKFNNSTEAVFGQATWDIDEQWSLTLGLRYTNETKDFLPDQQIITNELVGTAYNTAAIADQLAKGNTVAAELLEAFESPFLAVDARILPFVKKEVSIEEVTPMVNLSYRWTDSILTYVSYSEGFKSGGFSQRVFPPITVDFPVDLVPDPPLIDLIPTFEPEFVEVYEAGIKYISDDYRYRVNAAIFYTDYADMQIQVFESVAPVTKNAGSASIEGAELEAQALVGDDWAVEFVVGYLNAGYDEIDPVATLVDKGNSLERISEWTSSLAVTHNYSIDQAGRIESRVETTYHSKMYHETMNIEAIAQGDYALVNANIAWISADDVWRVTAGGSNLGNEDYLISGVAGDAFQSLEGSFDRGRQWYLSVLYEMY
ncbi:MAG: TonB-dependent receptor [Pseudomonadales bacterium]